MARNRCSPANVSSPSSRISSAARCCRASCQRRETSHSFSVTSSARTSSNPASRISCSFTPGGQNAKSPVELRVANSSLATRPVTTTGSVYEHAAARPQDAAPLAEQRATVEEVAHHVHETMASNAPIGEGQAVADVGAAEVDLVLQAGLLDERQPGPNARLIEVHAGHTATDFSRKEQRRAAGTATDVQDVVGRAQVQESEEPPVLVGGHPAALAEVFAVGIAPHLLQGLRGEIAVGRPVKIDGWGHAFLFRETEAMCPAAPGSSRRVWLAVSSCRNPLAIEFRKSGKKWRVAHDEKYPAPVWHLPERDAGTAIC